MKDNEPEEGLIESNSPESSKDEITLETTDTTPVDPVLPQSLIEWLAKINRRWLALQESTQTSAVDNDQDI